MFCPQVQLSYLVVVWLYLKVDASAASTKLVRQYVQVHVNAKLSCYISVNVQGFDLFFVLPAMAWPWQAMAGHGIFLHTKKDERKKPKLWVRFIKVNNDFGAICLILDNFSQI